MHACLQKVGLAVYCSIVTMVIIFFNSSGFATAKGSLVRSILFPKPLDSKMLKDIMKFVIFLAILGAFAFAYTIIILRLHHVSYKHVFK